MSCNTTETNKQDVNVSFIDSIHNNCKSIQITFFTDFAKSKVSTIGRYIKDTSAIDSVFSFIGNKSNDRCYLSDKNYPSGEIYFYNDTSAKNVITSLYFTLNDSCQILFSGFQKYTHKFDIHTNGVNYLKELQISHYK